MKWKDESVSEADAGAGTITLLRSGTDPLAVDLVFRTASDANWNYQFSF